MDLNTDSNSNANGGYMNVDARIIVSGPNMRLNAEVKAILDAALTRAMIEVSMLPGLIALEMTQESMSQEPQPFYQYDGPIGPIRLRDSIPTQAFYDVIEELVLEAVMALKRIGEFNSDLANALEQIGAYAAIYIAYDREMAETRYPDLGTHMMYCTNCAEMAARLIVESERRLGIAV